MDDRAPAIRTAGIGDIGVVQRVAQVTWAATYAAILPEEIRHRLLDAWYSEPALTRALRAAGSAFLVAEVGGRVVGFAQYERRSADVAELTRIYVLPEHQHAGIGSRLLEAALAACRQQGVSRLTVAVERDNAAGRRFYRSRGFAEVSERGQDVGGFTLQLVDCQRPVAAAPDPPRAGGAR
jgi:ribosomal protein S18 acetylase RimI-like enzyme